VYEGKTTGKGLESEHPTQQQQKSAGKGTESPPPIILTATAKLLTFQGNLKSVSKGSSEFRNTGNSIKVVVKEMTDFSAILRHLDTSNLPYYTFHPTSLKPIK